eukprot:142332-Pelagomonas_calceolata.AAC.4
MLQLLHSRGSAFHVCYGHVSSSWQHMDAMCAPYFQSIEKKNDCALRVRLRALGKGCLISELARTSPALETHSSSEPTRKPLPQFCVSGPDFVASLLCVGPRPLYQPPSWPLKQHKASGVKGRLPLKVHHSLQDSTPALPHARQPASCRWQTPAARWLTCLGSRNHTCAHAVVVSYCAKDQTLVLADPTLHAPSSVAAAGAGNEASHLWLPTLPCMHHLLLLLLLYLFVDVLTYTHAVLVRFYSVHAGGQPLVVADPTGPTASAFMELGAAVVREVAKMSSSQGGAASKAPKVAYDQGQHAILVRVSGVAHDQSWHARYSGCVMGAGWGW